MVAIRFMVDSTLVHEKTGGKLDLVVEEMNVKQARLFTLLDLGKFMGK